ncbi:tissue factor isoform 2-T2 [Rhinophrynus dorsalis]
MYTSALLLRSLLFCSVFCWPGTQALETQNFNKAVNITWSSINFKTILEWQPKPTNYLYTVEVASEGKNWIKKCILSPATECDVTDLLESVKETYQARIISEVPADEDITEEFPYSVSPPFTPYQQTIIGTPSIESYNFSKDHTKLSVLIKDQLTPYRFPNNSFKSIRDIFKDDFQYTLYYRKSSSTGKKQEVSTNNEITINVDKGESYCFFAQATIPSRRQNRDSQESEERCTSNEGHASRGIASTHEYLYLCSLILLCLLL